MEGSSFPDLRTALNLEILLYENLFTRNPIWNIFTYLILYTHNVYCMYIELNRASVIIV